MMNLAGLLKRHERFHLLSKRQIATPIQQIRGETIGAKPRKATLAGVLCVVPVGYAASLMLPCGSMTNFFGEPSSKRR